MKKRSLFVATAMLLVAVLVATGATYAWFQGVQDAKTTITMGVDNSDSLEISSTGLDGSWRTTLTTDDYENLSSAKWSDYSITDTGFNAETVKFFSDDYAKQGEEGYGDNTPDGYIDSATPISTIVHFRANKAGVVTVKGTLAAANKPNNTDLDPALRLGCRVAADNAIIFANNTGYSKAISDIDGTEAKQTCTQLSASSATSINVELTDADNDGWFTGQATFYYWVEGPLCSNAMSTSATTATADLTFAWAEKID